MPAPERVVINTGPLLALMRGGVLHLLPSLSQRFFTTSQVLAELASKVPDPASLIAQADVRVEPLSAKLDPALVKALDSGEASVIQLALELNIQTVCIDEKKGRRFARRRGLTLTGALGVLLMLKRRKLIEAVAPPIKSMLAAGTYLSADLVEAVLAEAGEQSAA